MNETIIVAIIAFFGSLIGNYIVNNKHQAIIAYRLEQLERKVEVHNQVIDRTYGLEKGVSLLDNNFRDLKEEIHDLKSKDKG